MANKVAIITAASKGIGAACARKLNQEGYQLVMMSRSEDCLKLARELNGKGLQGSVNSEKNLNDLVKTALENFGRIDAVVNNTGHVPKGDLPELKDDDWQKGMDMILMNVIRISKKVVPVMLKQKSGSIVNISTFAAFEPSLDFPVSSVFRAALGSYTKLFANRYASENIRMNSVLPGYINSYPADHNTVESIPMSRQGTVEEIAETVSFLLSERSSYTTGQNIRVDGGISRSV